MTNLEAWLEQIKLDASTHPSHVFRKELLKAVAVIEKLKEALEKGRGERLISFISLADAALAIDPEKL